MLSKRRETLKNGNIDAYNKLVIEYAAEEGKIEKLKISEVCEKLGINLNDFNKSLDHYNKSADE